MKKIFDLCGTPYVDDSADLPPTGEYFAIMTDYNAQIFFIDEVQDTILLIEYLLISCESFRVYIFTETYSMDLKNPRFAKLYSYLQKLFSDDELTFEENLCPTIEKIRLGWDFLGGHAYPIVSEREYLYNPFKEAEYTNKVDEILNRARDLLNASEGTPFDSLESHEEKSSPGEEMNPLGEENAREEDSDLMVKTVEVNDET